MTKQELINHLNQLFYYKGRGANNGEWHSYPTRETYDSTFTDFAVPHGNKDYGHVLIRYYIDEYNKVEQLGHEICIELYIAGSWETHFSGWIKSLEDLHILLRMLGIPTKEYPVYTSLDSWILKGKGIIYNVIYEGPDIDPTSLLDTEIILDGKLSMIRGVEHWAVPEIKAGTPLGILKYEH